jgi:hypothetical protein
MRPDFDDAPAATGLRKSATSTTSTTSIARYALGKARTILLLACCISIFSYLWLLYFSDRLSTAYVSPDLLGASNILWVTAHRA